MNALIVTVAYNPEPETLNNLQVSSLKHQVVDNSEHETVWLKDYCLAHGHGYLWLGGNQGIAVALNRGAALAEERGYDYIISMDQDSQLTNDLLVKMTNFINTYSEKDKVAIFSPRHVNPGPDLHLIKQEVSNDFYAMSSGNWVNLGIWRQLSGFNEPLFIDMVDVEYYARALIAGYQVLTLHRITMQHKMGERPHIRWIGKYGFDIWNHGKIRKYYQARNFFYVYQRYHQKLPELIFIKKMIRKMPISILLFEDDKLAKLYYFARGYLDYLRGRLGKISFGLKNEP